MSTSPPRPLPLANQPNLVSAGEFNIFLNDLFCGRFRYYWERQSQRLSPELAEEKHAHSMTKAKLFNVKGDLERMNDELTNTRKKLDESVRENERLEKILGRRRQIVELSESESEEPPPKRQNTDGSKQLVPLHESCREYEQGVYKFMCSKRNTPMTRAQIAKAVVRTSWLKLTGTKKASEIVTGLCMKLKVVVCVDRTDSIVPYDAEGWFRVREIGEAVSD
jgi:hypothetical protein